MAEDRKEVAAYIPWKTLQTATEILEQGLPRRLDPSVFPSFSGSIKSWTLSAFRFFGFINAQGEVQERLKAWVNQPEARPAMMKDILLEKYPKLIALAAENGTVNQMKEGIGDLGVSGTTAQKAMAFFIKACEYAGITLPVAWTKAKLSVSTPRRIKPKTPAAKGAGTPNTNTSAANTLTTKKVNLQSGGTVTLMIDANPWTTSIEDRDWLFRLVDELNAYESGELDLEDDDLDEYE